MDGIADSIYNACSPRIPIDIGIENVKGKSVIVLDVLAGSRCPYFIKAEGDKDGVYVRVGATTQRADDATRHELALEAEGRSFDSEPCPNAKITEARIAALCASMYRIARSNARSESERKAVRKITPNQLQAWGIYMNVIEEWGSGLRRVLEELAAYGVKPLQIEDSGIDVRVNVFRNAALGGEESEDPRHVERGSRSDRQKSTPKEVGVNERANEKVNEKVNERANERVGERVNERQAAIIAIVSDNPYITQSELASRLGISLVHVNKNMKKLQGLSVIRRVGPDKGGHWEVLQGQGQRSEPQLLSDAGSSPPQREGAGN